jgi:hypothetical protein
MSWKKHFTVYQGVDQTQTRSSTQDSTNKFQSWLPEVYTGQLNRVDRYAQYDQMDMDSEVNAALDTIAEFCTQSDDEVGNPFKIVYKDTPSETESKILETTLRQWCNLNDWDKRMFKTFRNTIKYGDQPFIRDPETWVMHYVNPQHVSKVVVNENEGKKPEQYIVNGIDLNLENKTASEPVQYSTSAVSASGPAGTGNAGMMNTQGTGPTADLSETHVGAEHVVHVALTEGMDINWPFGNSILDPVFKTYKQKELLEDSIIIYRVQRAPERRVFYIDVGNMPPHKANSFVERVKNEIHQKRIPNKTGGGNNMMDASYNPLSVMEDYFFSQTAEGRGSKVEVLPGGDNLGDIDDLKYFNNKLNRALRIPSSYLPSGPDDGTASYQDGRVGAAFIQEFRFTKYCMRLQNMIQPTFDKEFKLFLKQRGHQIDSSMFDLRFTEPQNFSQYREIEIDGARANVFGQLEGVDYLSRRFILKKYLGLDDAEILENERQMREEKGSANVADTQSGADRIGVKASTMGGFDDLDDLGAEADAEAEVDDVDDVDDVDFGDAES